jgi:hypothetical protein
VRVLVLGCLWLTATLSAPVVSAAAATPVVPAGQDHACIVGTPPRDGIDWGALRNPVLSYRDTGVKDQALQWSDGEWHMLFSDMTALPKAPHVRFDVDSATSADLVHWSAPRVIATDAASPDIVRDPAGQFVITYQTTAGQLEYRTATSSALMRWSAPHALAPGLAHRMIDGALAFTGHGVMLGFKAGTTTQHFEIAWAPSLSGTFRLIGRPDITIYNDTIENDEFLTVDGFWVMVATSNVLDQPFIFTLSPGNPEEPATWLHWSAGRHLIVPAQSFDTGQGISSVSYEQDNSAYLCVGPGNVDYLTYAGSTELTAFGGWGHARIGIARSSDLTNWQVPPT